MKVYTYMCTLSVGSLFLCAVKSTNVVSTLYVKQWDMPAPKRIFQTTQSRMQLFLLLAFLKVKIVSCGEIETVLFSNYSMFRLDW